MSDPDQTTRDALWRMFEENATESRHFETQRSTVSGILLTVSAAIIGVITFDKGIAGARDWPLCVLLFFIGLFGVGFTLKHVEQSNRHMARAEAYRDRIDELLPTEGELKSIEDKVDVEHKKKWIAFFFREFRLGLWWAVLNLLIAIMGAFLWWVAVFQPIPAPPTP